jgi:chromosomal replication initiation ATPase DnaA
LTSRRTRRAPAFRRVQIAFDLPAPAPAYDTASFIVSEANERAFSLLRRFPQTDDLALALCGPRDSGKTHLLHVVTGDQSGVIASAARLGDYGAEIALFAIDDAQTAEPATLHAVLEKRRDRGLRTIIAGSGRPREWAHGLSDLESRLEALPRADLFEPDEALIEALLSRRFGGLQLRIAAAVPRFAAPRIPRTFAAVAAFVEAARRESADSGGPVNVALAKKVIRNLFEVP